MYGDVYDITGELQIWGKTGWYGKVCSQAGSLDFMIELQDVICHGQDGPFSIYLDVSPEKETPEIHILFCHCERTFGLYTAVNPKKFSKGSIDHDFHSFPLLGKALGNA